MAHRLTSLLLRHRTTTIPINSFRHHFTIISASTSRNPFLQHFLHPPKPSIRFLSTRSQPLPGKVDIAAEVGQLQMRRQDSYAVGFIYVAGLVAIALTQYQDWVVLYQTPSKVMEQYSQDPSKSKFRLGGVVLEGSLTKLSDSSQTQFVVTDSLTDIVVRYEGRLPYLVCEGKFVSAEGVMKPLTDGADFGQRDLELTGKARSLGCCFYAEGFNS